jgi:hypothetical protein
MVAAVALAGAVSGCGGLLSHVRTNPAALLQASDACLERHGIAHPFAETVPSAEELAVPSLAFVRGLRVPPEVTRERFEAALRACGDGSVHVGQAPITNSLLQARILEARACLMRNGFQLPPPDFAGPGPVFDTHGIDIMSARWMATAYGCGVTRKLTPNKLAACTSAHTLVGNADNAAGSQFRLMLLQLGGCLKAHEPPEKT